MKKTIAKKVAEYLVTLIVVSVLIFVLIRLSRIDPVAVILGGKNTSADVVANTRASFNLDKPLPVQYWLWIKGLLTGNWGLDYKYQQPVMSLIGSRVPVTAGLVVGGTILSLGVSIPLGVYTALKKNTWVDTLISTLSLIAAAIPPFVMSVVIVLILAKVAPSFPITGTYNNVGEYFTRIIFPCIAMALVRMTLTMRVTRSGMTTQLESNYVQTLIAKGLPTSKIVFKHCLKNAIIPVLSVVGIQVGGMIVGAVLVESIFSLSGIGSLLIDAVKASNYPIVQDVVLILVVIYLTISTIIDILYCVIDPRIRLGAKEAD